MEVLFDYYARFSGSIVNKRYKGLIRPNSWGKSSYMFDNYKLKKENILDLNNIRQKRGWIQAYTTKMFYGLKVKKSDKLVLYSNPFFRLVVDNDDD